MLEIKTYVLGPVQTNSYLVADVNSGSAVVIDPAWDGHTFIEAARENSWTIDQIWLTHAHFDHMAGAGAIVTGVSPRPGLALHPGDLPLYKIQGGAPFFGMSIDPGPEPDMLLSHGQELKIGESRFIVRYTPGHTLGHVIFQNAEEKLVFSGDLIFLGSVGRTDLPGGSHATLISSIREHILHLPDDTRLLSGHGPETTVGQEKQWNPFLV
jgi:hydroxyacylglutathione hydrolase